MQGRAMRQFSDRDERLPFTQAVCSERNYNSMLFGTSPDKVHHGQLWELTKSLSFFSLLFLSDLIKLKNPQNCDVQVQKSLSESLDKAFSLLMPSSVTQHSLHMGSHDMDCSDLYIVGRANSQERSRQQDASPKGDGEGDQDDRCLFLFAAIFPISPT